MDKCIVCKRPLTSAGAMKNGMGKACAKKMQAGAFEKQIAVDADEIVPYDGGDVFIEREMVIGRPFLELTGLEKLIGDGEEEEFSVIKTNVPRQRYKHSPIGYNFGYGGSGPADFALNICLLFACQKRMAERVYQKFKENFCMNKGDDDRKLVIPKTDIIAWFKKNKVAVKKKFKA